MTSTKRELLDASTSAVLSAITEKHLLLLTIILYLLLLINDFR